MKPVTTLQGGVDRFRHAVRHRAQDLDSLREDAVYYIKRRPLRAMSLAAGVAAACGAVSGWIIGRHRGRH